MRIYKLLNGKLVYRRVGPKPYLTTKQSRVFDRDEKHDIKSLNRFNRKRRLHFGK